MRHQSKMAGIYLYIYIDINGLQGAGGGGEQDSSISGRNSSGVNSDAISPKSFH